MKITLNKLVLLASLVVMFSSGCIYSGIGPFGGTKNPDGTSADKSKDIKYSAYLPSMKANISNDTAFRATISFNGNKRYPDIKSFGNDIIIIPKPYNYSGSRSQALFSNTGSANLGNHLATGTLYDGDKPVAMYSIPIKVDWGGWSRFQDAKTYKISKYMYGLKTTQQHSSGQSVGYNEPYYRGQGVFGPWEGGIRKAFKDYNSDGSRKKGY